MKRITHFPQLILGLAFSMSILMVYSQSKNDLPLSCWILFIANVLWTLAYDTYYAMTDRDTARHLQNGDIAYMMRKFLAADRN